jgi:hypothetical protein
LGASQKRIKDANVNQVKFTTKRPNVQRILFQRLALKNAMRKQAATFFHTKPEQAA